MMLIEASAEKIAGEVFNASENNYKVIEIAEMAKEVVGFENGLIPDYENT
jgi:hypothetical protein